VIEVINKVQIYEKGGEDVPPGKDAYLTIKSHWNLSERVILRFGKTELTVLAKDLIAAVKNAQNTERF
jgi:hypothetical protein